MPARVTQGGRLVLPAAIRKAMNPSDGEVVMLELHDNVLQIIPLRERLDAIQQACAPLLTGGRVVEEFHEERRREASQEFSS